MTNLYTQSFGQGETVLMIHGWAMHSEVWRHFAQQLSSSCRVICIDLPGHGRSEAVHPLTLENIGRAIMQEMQGESMHVLGWSLGGTVALELAVRFPEQIKSVTVLAGNPSFVQKADWPGVRPEVLQTFADNLIVSCQDTLVRFLALQVNTLPNAKSLLKQLRSALEMYEPPSQRVLADALSVLRNSDFSSSMAVISCPVQFILGANDTLVPVACASHIKQAFPAFSVRVLDNAGHVPFLSHPEQLLEMLVEFIQ